MRGVTVAVDAAQNRMIISTHTPHARRDSWKLSVYLRTTPFQLTRLMRGVTSCYRTFYTSGAFQLTRLMRGVTGVGMTINDLIAFQLTRLMRGVTRKN